MRSPCIASQGSGSPPWDQAAVCGGRPLSGSACHTTELGAIATARVAAASPRASADSAPCVPTDALISAAIGSIAAKPVEPGTNNTPRPCPRAGANSAPAKPSPLSSLR